MEIPCTLKRKRSDSSSEELHLTPRLFFLSLISSSNSDSTTEMKLTQAAKQFPNEEIHDGIPYSEFANLLKPVGLPVYWKKPFWMALNLTDENLCTSEIFIPFLTTLLYKFSDESSQFLHILFRAAENFPELTNQIVNVNPKKTPPPTGTLSMGNFVPLVQDIIATHPGLHHLRNNPNLHTRYILCVISRIFYEVNRSWSGYLTLREIRNSNLLQAIRRLEETLTMNSLEDCFSYQGFRKINHSFNTLGNYYDFISDLNEFERYENEKLGMHMIERIFNSRRVLQGWYWKYSDSVSSPKTENAKMTFCDFVWFILSERAKTTRTAIEYWFRCLDNDEDGILSAFELQPFYEEQHPSEEMLEEEYETFKSFFCRSVDMLRSSVQGIYLMDLKRSPCLASLFFNMLFISNGDRELII